MRYRKRFGINVLSLAILYVATLPAVAGEDACPSPAFEVVRENPSVNGERREVVRFCADGLRQYGLVLWPPGPAPERGWPLLLFNHGYHPDPPAYGRVAGGRSDRPGDYYRGVAQAYVDSGLVVVVPDYRGHNDSEGLAFTRRDDATRFYARDAVAAFRAAALLDAIDPSRRYLLGHSMGGPVTVDVLAEVGADVAAAAIWSTAAVPASARQNWQVPLLLQHAEGDATTPITGAEALLAQRRAGGHTVALYRYPGSDHLFTGADFDRAVARDLAWFLRHSR